MVYMEGAWNKKKSKQIENGYKLGRYLQQQNRKTFFLRINPKVRFVRVIDWVEIQKKTSTKFYYIKRNEHIMLYQSNSKNCLLICFVT